MKRIFFLMFAVLLALPLCSAEQVLWNNDSDIEIFDVWADITGNPLTEGNCSWQVYNLDASLNQSGTPSELSIGIINFTVNQLSIGIYPMLINCTKNNYNGTSTKDLIKIVDELSEEYKTRLVEINQTTKDIYDFLLNDMNETLTNILNLTDLTYEKVLEIDSDISDMSDSLNSLRSYLESKWGNKDADKIYDKLKDIKSDLSYLKSEFYYMSQSARNEVLLSIKGDTREMLNTIYDDGIKLDGILIWVIPSIVIVLIIIIIIYLIRRKPKVVKSFGGDMHGRNKDSP